MPTTHDDLELMYQHIAQQVRALRIKQGLNAVQLAREVGISNLPVTSIEHGNSKPDLVQLCALADYFQVSLDEIVGRPIKISFAPRVVDDINNTLAQIHLVLQEQHEAVEQLRELAPVIRQSVAKDVQN